MSTLAEKQEQMRLSNLRKLEEKRKPATKAELLRCTSPNCKRQARQGSHLCSRCTQGQVQNRLRDTLPGMAIQTDDQKIKAVERALDDTPVPIFVSFNKASSWSAVNEPDHSQEVSHAAEPSALGDDVSGGHRAEGTSDDSQFRDPALFHLTGQEGPTFTRAEVCRLIGIRPKTLGNWEKKGKVPLPRKLVHNNQYVYTDENIRAIREFMTAEVILVASPTKSSPPKASTLDEATSKLSIKSSKKVERTVAARLSTFHRGPLI